MSNFKRSSAKARLLEATVATLREAGMSGTGIKDLVVRSRTPIGSLYHYFPDGKTQLVVESLKLHGEEARRLLGHFFDGKKTAATALRSLFNTAAEEFEQRGANKGCAIGAVALDLTPSDNEVRNVCKNTFDEWVSLIAPRIPFRDGRSRHSFAIMVVAALEGAFVLGRAMQSGEPFRASGEWLAAAVSQKGAVQSGQKSRR